MACVSVWAEKEETPHRKGAGHVSLSICFDAIVDPGGGVDVEYAHAVHQGGLGQQKNEAYRQVYGKVSRVVIARHRGDEAPSTNRKRGHRTADNPEALGFDHDNETKSLPRASGGYREGRHGTPQHLLHHVLFGLDLGGRLCGVSNEQPSIRPLKREA